MRCYDMQGIRYGPPLKLYDLCMNVIIAGCTSRCVSCKKEFRLLPNTSLVDFYERLYQDRRLCILAKEFSILDICNRLLYVKGKRHFLLSCYQALLNHDQTLTKNLFDTFQEYTSRNCRSDLDLIEMGLRMGSFLNDGGWCDYSIRFLNITETLLSNNTESEEVLLQLLECYRLKLYAESVYCQFYQASKTYSAALKVIEKLKEISAKPPLAGIYCSFSTYQFVRSNFDESYNWAVKALQLLPSGLSKRTILEVLRQTSKSCVVKRKFIQAGLLIRQAMNLGEMMRIKEQLPTFSDILMDYGFFLLNSDSVGESVFVYEKALTHRRRVFENNNIHIALAHEDLAYSLYVNEYSSGNFWMAREHAENSIRIMEKVLPKDHLLLASVKRVKALILEEIALDERSNEDAQKKLLATAEELHITALRLSRESFGEKNVQTAKHYGNLGRLYQSMKQFEEAEKMHLKAIAIKEELLGPNDYEVGLSVGHLASLYNYHMKKYTEAEELYLRSIEINIRLFGPAYSGLEYDYRGLINIYNRLVEPLSALFYTAKYREWKELRDKMGPLRHKEPLLAPKEVLKLFFEIGEQQNALEEERARLAEEFRQGKDKRNSALTKIALKEVEKLINRGDVD